MRLPFGRIVSALAGLGFLVLLAVSLTDRSRMNPWFSALSYWAMWGILIFWVSQFWKLKNTLQFSIRAWTRNHWVGLVSAFALASLIFISVKPGLRTLSDETNLLAVSKSFLYERAPFNTTMGKYYYSNFNPINREIPTRPLLFPFLTSLVHTALGSQYENVFILNFIFLVALFVSVYAIARTRGDRTLGVAAMLLVASYPVFAIYGTGGGFDLCSTVFFIISMIALAHFLRKPSSAAFGFLWISLFAFSQIRYESILVGAVVFLGLALGRLRGHPWLKWEWIRSNSFLILCTPLLFLPTIWQRFLTDGHYENPPGVPLFSYGRFVAHFRDLLTSLGVFNHDIPYANGLTWLALILVFLQLGKLPARWVALDPSRKMYWGIFGISVLVVNVLFLSHHFGVYYHPTQARFFMILSLVTAMAPIWMQAWLPQWLTSRTLLGMGVVMFLIHHPIAVEGRYINALILDRETDYSYAFLKRKNDRNIFVINDRPGQYTALDYGAVDFRFAQANSENVLSDLKRHLFKEIYVFQHIEYSTGKPPSNYELGPAFKLIPEEEIQITATEFLRISRVAP